MVYFGGGARIDVRCNLFSVEQENSREKFRWPSANSARGDAIERR
jgi:hypothetical protein